MKGSECVSNYILLWYYKWHKINSNRCALYVNTPDWIKNKKATTNSKNNKDKKRFLKE